MARSSNLPEPTASAAPVRALGARRLLLALAVVLALYAVDLACAATVPASAHAFAVNVAVPFDLMVCVPAAFYLLVVRRRGLTPLAVLPVVWAGYLAASQLAAPGLLSPLAVSAAAGSAGTFSLLPPLFAAALALDAAVIACEARRLVRAFRAARRASARPYDWFAEAFKVLAPGGRAAHLAGIEGATWYYALFSWRARPDAPAGRHAFSYHRESGFLALVGVIAALLPVEAFAVHLLVAQWSTIAACLLTATSLYALLWLAAAARASVLNPLLVDDETLTVRWAAFVCEDVPLRLVTGVGAAAPDVPKRERLDLSVMGAPPCWIELSEPLEVRTLAGTRRPVRAINVSPDNAAAFKRLVGARLR